MNQYFLRGKHITSFLINKECITIFTTISCMILSTPPMVCYNKIISHKQVTLC